MGFLDGLTDFITTPLDLITKPIAAIAKLPQVHWEAF